MKLIYALFVLSLISLAAGAPDEATGRVSKIVDGENILEMMIRWILI